MKIAPGFDFNNHLNVEKTNIYKIDKLFTDMKLPENHPDDYYFVVIGDTRNIIRSNDLSNFNQLAKQIIYAEDENGKSIYDRIRFIIHMGDLVYEGAEKHQWNNLKKAFSNKDYFSNNYPYIKILVKDKPIFPVLGNHDVMKLRLKKETTYLDFASSGKGLNHFKEFFDWDNFMADPNIICPLPGKLKKTVFDQLCKKLGKDEIKDLEKHYILKADHIYYLRLYQDVLDKYRNGEGLTKTKTIFFDQIKKKEVVKDLQRIFIKLGYNTLPVINSDNMIFYAFEINDLIYVVYDSLSRGWHYNTFSDLKKSIYHQKSRQHYLNLFTKSDLNGQYEFFKALSDYAEERGKTIVPFMHHSPFNSVQDIDAGGMEYNLKLILGVEYKKKNKSYKFDKNISEYSFFDDLIFMNQSDPSKKSYPDNYFTSCVHYFQSFTLETLHNNQIRNKINWYISGGGGAELNTRYNNDKLNYSEMLYNKKLKNSSSEKIDDESAGKSIRIINNDIKEKYNFLVGHVKNSKIINVIPHFIEEKNVRLKKPLFRFSVKIEYVVLYPPVSESSLMSFTVGSWGLEKIMPMLSFITWDPSFGIGSLEYNMYKGDNERINSLTQFDPLKFTFHFTDLKEITFLLSGITIMDGGANSRRTFFSFGIEGPILYNFFSNLREPIPEILKKFSFGFKYHIPFHAGNLADQDYGKNTRWSWAIQFKLL